MSDSYENYLRWKKINDYQNMLYLKKKRRYKKYLNIEYLQPLVIAGNPDLYKDKAIELLIKNKWLERRLKRYNNE